MTGFGGVGRHFNGASGKEVGVGSSCPHQVRVATTRLKASAGIPQTRCRSQAGGGVAVIQTRPSGLRERRPRAPATMSRSRTSCSGV